ncbi:MAG: phosphatase PAP2 family protein [Pseudoxanthomonas sp.]
MHFFPRELAHAAPSRMRSASLDIRPATWVQQLLVPFFIYAALMAWAVGAHGDLRIADGLYAWQGHAWALHANRITEQWLHVGGKRASTAAWLLAALAWVLASRRSDWAAWRRPLGYLLLSVLLSTVLVAWLKSRTHMDCPWDLLRYGGTREYVPLLAVRPPGMAHGGCFPAGHASAGYAWMALYFCCAAVRPRWRWWGLGIGIVAGIAFGLAQQLRGAHFLSHDLTTAMLCWSVAVLLDRLLLSRTLPNHASPARHGAAA